MEKQVEDVRGTYGKRVRELEMRLADMSRSMTREASKRAAKKMLGAALEQRGSPSDAASLLGIGLGTVCARAISTGCCGLW